MTFSKLLEAHNAGREIIFDLDNTIYQETDFLFPAYKRIANCYFEAQATEVYDFLVNHFIEKGRNKLFDNLLNNFQKYNVTKSQLIYTLRTSPVTDNLIPYRWFNHFIDEVDDEFILRIITNGNPHQQMHKLKSIEWPKKIQRTDIILANRFKPKPAPDSFYALTDACKFKSPIYVGDSESDELFANNISIDFLDANLLKIDNKSF